MKRLVLFVVLAGCGGGVPHHPAWFSGEVLRGLISSSGTVVRGRMVIETERYGSYHGTILVTKVVLGSAPASVRFSSETLEQRTGEMLFFLHYEGANTWRVISPPTGLLGIDPGEEAPLIDLLRTLEARSP
jgi:hypothetical protein